MKKLVLFLATLLAFTFVANADNGGEKKKIFPSVRIEKRVYNKGFHISFNSNRNNAKKQNTQQVVNTKEVAQSSAVLEAKEVEVVEAINNNAVAEVEVATINEVATNNNVAKTTTKVIKPTKAEKAAVKELAKEVKKIQASENTYVPSSKEALESTTISTDQLLLVILAVILPPLAVFLVSGLGIEFWIDLILTCLFWIPGLIYALIQIL